MGPEVEVIGSAVKIVLDYGVVGFGWIGWYFERKRANRLTTQLINFLARQELIKESPDALQG